VTACAVALIGAGCGGVEATRLTQPASTPPWVREFAWSAARGLGDAHPDKITIRRGHDKGGDFWGIEVRGELTCDSCSHLGDPESWKGYLATYRVEAATREATSFGFRGHRCPQWSLRTGMCS
jgi:hypothetical protein